tara:strand:- start:414 stop:1109 length:696 start_codon:yes stop_codon:yes gene_type:complete
MHSNSYTIIFTSIVTIILGFFLSVLAGSLKATQKENIDNDIKKNILVSLGYKPADNNPWTSAYIQELFDNNIDAFVMDKNGKRTLQDPKSIDTEKDIENLPIYVNIIDGQIDGYSIPISGKGLWSTLLGYFAIEPDGSTAKGITFYSHKETPGLGGEVDKAWFQNNFIGKKFINENGELVGIKIRKGKADPNSLYEVDGISGATVTSKGLETFLLDDLKKYDSFFKKIREE